MLQDAKRLAERGAAIHWLRPKSKAPVDAKWSTAPVNTAADLEDTYRKNCNVGMRTGEPSKVSDKQRLYVVDVDVKGDDDDAAEAYEALEELIPRYAKLPYVKSGRGGESIHLYCTFDGDVPSKKLAHSNKKVEWTDKAGKTHHSWAWEIELFGTGKQVAIPPSIHPETGREYAWGQEIDWDDLDSMYVDLSEIAPKGDDWEEPESRGARDDDSSQSLSEVVKRKPLGITEDEAWDFLRDLSLREYCDDRDGWLKVGMALHHEFEGTDAGLELWHDWSKKSDKYDADDLDRVWDSFGKDKRRRPVRFATLIAAGAHKRLKREHTGADDDDPLDDDDDPNAWLSLLTINEKGNWESTSHNLSKIVANDVRFKGTFGRNRFIEDVCIVQKPPIKLARSEKKQKNMSQLQSWLWDLSPTEEREGRPLEDEHVHEIRACIEAPTVQGGYRIKVTDRDLAAAISIAANQAPYHPVQKWLDSLEWDGIERMDYMFVDYFGCPEDSYHTQTSALFLLAAVARVFEPGHKFDFVPIVEGPQGIRKSTFIRYLGMHWYVELDCPFDDPKRVVETLVGQWIAEIPELSQFGRSEIAAIKAFFSKGEEKVREAYGRKAKRFFRQSVYMGTTNDSEYLRDPTGNRRFWPIKCLTQQIDTDKLKLNVEQIWAEATARYKELRKEHPPGALPLYLKGKEARATALALQESRRIETQSDGWAGLISTWANEEVRQSVIDGLGEDFERHDGRSDPLARRELICGLQVWIEALKGSSESYGRGNTLKVIEAIRATGEWEDAGSMRLPVYGKQRCFKRLERRKKTISDLLA